MKTGKKLLAVLLSAILLFTALPVQAVQASDRDTYLQGLKERTTAYMDSENSVYWLYDGTSYVYYQWADMLYEFNAMDIAWSSRVFLWSTRKLMGQEITTQTYVDHLSKILAMMEKSYMDTTAAQMTYEVKTNLGEKIANAAGVTLKKFLSAQMFEDLGDAIGNEINVIELGELSEKIISSSAEAAVVMAYGQIFEKKRVFLETIRDNTEDKHLKEAAEDLIKASSLSLIYVLENYSTELLASATEAAWDLVNPSDMKFMEQVGIAVTQKLSPWIDGIASKVGAKALSKYVISGIKHTAEFTGLMMIGFEIGGAIGNVFWGDKLSLYTQMQVMYEISKTLRTPTAKFAIDANNAGADETLYDAAFKMVACGEALAYLHYCGEYSYLQTIENKEGFDNVRNDLKRNLQRITTYYTALGEIFPEKTGKVSVYAQMEHYSTYSVDAIRTVPVVHIEGKNKISEKINNSQWLKDFDDNARTCISELENSGVYGSYPNMYRDALASVYVVQNAISLTLSNMMYYSGSAHGMHGLFSGNYDLTTGEKLSLDDILDENNTQAMSQLTNLYIEAFKAEYGNGEALFTDGYTAMTDFMKDVDYRDQSWSFTESGLRIFFLPYMIGPYVAGVIEFYVPYSKLSGIIKEEYFPADRTTLVSTGNTTVLSAADLAADSHYSNMMPLNVYGDASAAGYAVVTNEGSIADVTVRDQTDSMDIVLFYTTRMDQNDLVWLPSYPNGEGAVENEYDVSVILKNDSESMETKDTITYKIANGQCIAEYK